MTTRKTTRKSPTSSPKEVTIPKLEAKANDEQELEFDFHTVQLQGNQLKFIPGPKGSRIKVLKAWCNEYATGKWKMLDDTISWVFTNKDDANAFRKAWCSRLDNGTQIDE